MKGIVIWAQSDCRSTMGLYEEIIKQAAVPVEVSLWFYSKTKNDNRSRIGFSSAEFSHVHCIPVGEDFERGLRVLDDHPGWVHVFTVFQKAPVWRRLIYEVHRRGEKVVIACEAPCNMDKGWRKLLKELYLWSVLRLKARRVIEISQLFINYSGCDDKYAKVMGWPKNKIVPFGYFPPPIPSSNFCKRQTNRPFHILATGVLSYYRGADILVDALRLLRLRGVDCVATITQDGELLPYLKKTALDWNLPIEFPGFVEMKELVHLYESCSVYVGAGRNEPWGMRLNDALNCGAPIVVSRGMGGAKLVDDYGCGLTFAREDAKALADCLELLATDPVIYSRCIQGVQKAVEGCTPKARAAQVLKILAEVC